MKFEIKGGIVSVYVYFLEVGKVNEEIDID